MKPITFRHSTLKIAEFCPEKYRLQEIEGFKEPGLPNIALIFGTSIHSAIEAHFEGLEDASTVFSSCWKAVDSTKHNMLYSRYKFDELETVGQELLRKWVKLHSPHYEARHLEKHVTFRVNDYDMSGTIDFIGMYKGKLSIVDWKTSATDFNKKKIISDMQLWLYAHAARTVLGLPIEQVVYAPFIKNSIKIQTPIVEPVTDAKINLMLKTATDKMDQIMGFIRTNTWPKNTDNCLKCAFFSHCYGESK